jgi:hypothetical protein
MADQTRVIPIGVLSNISVIISDKPFRLNFLILDPVTPSTFPLLIGRPWLYMAKVNTNWGKKTFTFGTPKTTISWETIKYQGETPSTDSGYTSDASTLDTQWVNQVKLFEESDFEWQSDVQYLEVCTSESEEERVEEMRTKDVMHLPEELEEEMPSLTDLFEEDKTERYSAITLKWSTEDKEPERYNAIALKRSNEEDKIPEQEEIVIGSKELK